MALSKESSSMKVTKDGLKRLESQYSGYLEGEILDTFFVEFGIRFAAGHWAAGGFADRFAPGGYDPSLDDSTASQIERVAKAGVKGVEFHEALFIDDNYRTDKRKVNEVKAALAEYKLEPTNMNINLFSNPKWKLQPFFEPEMETWGNYQRQ